MKYSNSLTILGVFGFLLSAKLSTANSNSLLHDCEEPHLPHTFTKPHEIETFHNKLDEYKLCMETFIEEQESQAILHLEAADYARNEWDQFIDLTSKNWPRM